MLQEKLDELVALLETLMEQIAEAEAQVNVLQEILNNEPPKDGVVKYNFGNNVNSGMYIELPYVGNVVEIEPNSLYVINGYVVDSNKARSVEIVPNDVEEVPTEV